MTEFEVITAISEKKISEKKNGIINKEESRGTIKEKNNGNQWKVYSLSLFFLAVVDQYIIVA